MNQIASYAIGTVCGHSLIEQVKDISPSRVAIDQLRVVLRAIYKEGSWGNRFKRFGVRESSKSGCLEDGGIAHCHHGTDDWKDVH